MKLNGKKITGINEIIIAIPRGDNLSDAIIFKARSVMSMEPFERLCPEPKPPQKLKPGGVKEPDLKAPGFIAAMKQFGERRMAYMVLESLRATPDLEWESVNPENPETWTKYEQELKDSGFNQFEINKIVDGVFKANCLSEALVTACRDVFLLGIQAQPDESTGLAIAQQSS